MRPLVATTLTMAAFVAPAMTADHRVSIEGMAFSPATIRIGASEAIDCFCAVHPSMTGKITAR